MKKANFYRTVQIPAGYEFESTKILPIKGIMKCRIHIQRIPTAAEVTEENAKTPEPTEPTEAPQDATRQDGILQETVPQEPAKD